MSKFDELSQELESSIAVEPTSESEADGLAKAVTNAARDYLEKAKKGKKKGEKNPSDLTAEEISNNDEGEIEAGKDPAESPVASGGSYPDVKKYVKKAKDEDDEDEGDDDDDDEDDDEKPAFFKKKCVKKAVTEEEEVDATEFMTTLGTAVDSIAGDIVTLKKAVNMLMKGQAVTAELVTDIADPRKDRLLEMMAKSLVFITNENKEIRKALSQNTDMMKSVQKMPGMPVIAGMIASGTGGEDVKKAETLTKADKDMLMKARIGGQITLDQWRQSLATGDLSCVKK